MTAPRHDAEHRRAAPARDEAPAAPAAPTARPAERSLGNAVLAALGPQNDPIAAAVTRGIGAPGRPLDPATRATAQQRLGRDLGAVRVHDDAASADALGANAYTLGADVVLGAAAAHAPAERDRLLRHELTHVAQRAPAPAPAAPLRLSHPGSAAEREAATHGPGRAPLAPNVVARELKGPAKTAMALTPAQILDLWKAAKGDILEFKHKLFGYMVDPMYLTNAYLWEFLTTKFPGASEKATRPVRADEYQGPSIGPARSGEPIVTRDIWVTDPEGGSVRMSVTGTPAQIEAAQSGANEQAASMMFWGLMTGAAHIPAAPRAPPSAAARPTTTQEPHAQTQQPAPPPRPQQPATHAEVTGSMRAAAASGEIDHAIDNATSGKFVQGGEFYWDGTRLTRMQGESRAAADARRAAQGRPPQTQAERDHATAMRNDAAAVNENRPPKSGLSGEQLEALTGNAQQRSTANNPTAPANNAVAGSRLHGELARSNIPAVVQQQLGQSLAPGTRIYQEQTIGTILRMTPAEARTPIGVWLEQHGVPPTSVGVSQTMLTREVGALTPDLVVEPPGGLVQVLDLTSSPSRRHLAKTILYTVLVGTR